MNKYIYKVRLVTSKFPYITIRTKIIHKHESFFYNEQFNYNFNNRKNRFQTNYEKYECFMSNTKI